MLLSLPTQLDADGHVADFQYSGGRGDLYGRPAARGALFLLLSVPVDGEVLVTLLRLEEEGAPSAA